MENEISNLQIEKKIFVIRGVQVMVDRDIAELYGVETKRLNEQVKRNILRFPEDFMFQLTQEEAEYWMSQNAISNCSRSQIATLNKSRGSNIKYLPYVFTEQGCAMLSAVLKSDTAVQVSIQIMKAFVSMRHFVQNNSQIFAELKSIRQQKVVTVSIYTDPKTKLTAQDVQNFNVQYPTLTINYTTKMHDRFMIIDNKVLYHIGASLKDLGKKRFAFEILDASIIPAIMQNL